VALGLFAIIGSGCVGPGYALSGYPGWASAGTIQARRNHRATLLQDGRVLITGGIGRAERALDSFDPGTGTWTSLGQMKDARRNHTATLLADGRVLIYGGHEANIPVNSAEIFDPATGQSIYGRSYDIPQPRLPTEGSW
jgi:phosphatidylserine/phosphatidylglycerophosphate/cardiolipin synthase-like enzyme